MSRTGILWISVRLVGVVLIGLAVAALLSRVMSLFLFVCIVSALVAGILAALLLGRRFLASAGVHGPGTSLIRILGALLVTASVLFLLSFGPLNIDRSFSVWMLRRVAISDRPLTVAQTQQLAGDFFGQGSDEIERRILEQERLGNLRVENDQVTLTASGKRVVFLNEWLSRIFGLNPKYAQAEQIER
jgi:hypothetical protein